MFQQKLSMLSYSGFKNKFVETSVFPNFQSIPGERISLEKIAISYEILKNHVNFTSASILIRFLLLNKQNYSFSKTVAVSTLDPFEFVESLP